MEKHYQIFISSTLTDLEEERKKVIDAILECDCLPRSMELFPALDMEQFTYIKSVMDECDYYILVIGGRYGSLTDDGTSYTEKEFDYAVKKGVPILVFLKKDIDTIPANRTDNDAEQKHKLLNFREKVTTNRLVSYWDDPNELKSKIIGSLHKAFNELPQIKQESKKLSM